MLLLLFFYGIRVLGTWVTLKIGGYFPWNSSLWNISYMANLSFTNSVNIWIELKFNFQSCSVFSSGSCALFTRSANILFSKKKKKKTLKLDSTVLFTHLKIILLQCFQFSVFNNKRCLNRLSSFKNVVDP